MRSHSFTLKPSGNIVLTIGNFKKKDWKSNFFFSKNGIKCLFNKIVQKDKLVYVAQKKYMIIIFLISIFFLTSIIIVLNSFMLRFKASKCYISPEIYTSKSSVSFNISKNFISGNIFFCIDNLDFLLEKSEKDNDKCTHNKFTNENKLPDYHSEVINFLKRAKNIGLTDIVISESIIETDNLTKLDILKRVVNTSKSYNIKISLLLDQQYSVAFNNKYNLKREVFAYSEVNFPLFSNNGYMLNSENHETKLFIKKRINSFIKCGVNQFFFTENPMILARNEYDFFRLVNRIDFNLLQSRSQLILDQSPNVKLFYLYETEKQRIKIKENNINYYGGVLKISWFSFDDDELSAEKLNKIFKHCKQENKILLFDIATYDFDFNFIEVIIGLYLFSPIPTIFKIGHDFWNYCFTSLLSNEDCAINPWYVSFHNTFLYVLRLKTQDIFLRKNLKLLDQVRYKHGIILATAGLQNRSETSELLLMIFGKHVYTTLIDLKSIFPKHFINYYKIIFGDSMLEQSSIFNSSRKITLRKGQILVIKAYL